MKTLSAKKILCAGLSAALIVLSPGLPCYQALAANLAEAPRAAGLPAQGSFAARLTALSSPSTLPQFQGQTIQGVDIPQVLAALSSAGALRSPSILAKLGKLPENATDAQIVAAVAQAAAEARRAAGPWKLADTSEKTLARFEAHLVSLQADAPLLLPSQRETVSRALSSTRERLTALKQARAQSEIAAAEREWASAHVWENEGGAVPQERASAGAPALSKPASAAPQAAPAAAVERAAAPAVSLSAAPAAAKSSRVRLALAAGAVAVAAGLTLAYGFNPVTWLVVGGSALSILLHEGAHLVTLRWRGDDTAAKYGVKSANPLNLVDPLGTVGLPALTAAVTSALFGLPMVFGWAKPVPVDFNRPAERRLSAFLIAAAGPAANIALAAAFAGIAAAHLPVTLALAALSLAKINVLLAAFNLLPLPQLDGGKMVISALPAKAYEAVTRNSRIPAGYDKLSRRLYEGPSAILNLVGMDGQGQINWTTRAITLGAFIAFGVVAHVLIGGPILLAMLVCSYDYYCIREKIQNEAAVKALMDLLQGFAGELAALAEEDASIKSAINPEEVEHSLKNALEDTIDKVVGTDGFDGLTEEQKWERFEAMYKDAAVEALKAKGMSADDPAKIREVLESEWGKRLMTGVKAWMKSYDVFGKWHRPGQKQGVGDAVKKKGKLMQNGGKALGMLAIGLLGAHFGMSGFNGGMMGTVEQTGAAPQPSFEDALNDPRLQFSEKEKQFLLQFVTEMKLEEKPPVTGRVEEMVRAYKNVTAPRGDIASVVLIGEAGVGKTAIVEKLAQQLALAESSANDTFSLTKMQGRYLIRLDLSRVLIQDSPAAALDGLLSLLRRFNDPSKKSGNKVILFADEIHKLFQVQQGEQMANLIKEPLRDGSLAVIAATTRKEYKEYFEKDDAFRRRMVPIWVKEATNEETMRSLQGARSYYEGLYDAKITPEALTAATELSKYDQEVFLPGRAFKYLLAALRDVSFDSQRDRAGMRIADKAGELQYVVGRLSEELSKTSRVTTNIKEDEPTTIDLYNDAIRLTQELVALYRKRAAIPTGGTPSVTDGLVKEAISEETGIAAGQLSLGREPMEKYLNMEKLLGERVIGQEEPIHVIAEAVRQNKAGLSNPNRPIGSFYLTGPTGSGKTHLAKELARFLFGDPKAVIRFDMSEFMEPHTVARLFGSPPGYVGSMEGGQLTEKVRRQPYSVLLFDEFEKAHPDVKLALLQVLDDGRMTDGMGHTTDFKNTIILMTSNLGMYAVDVEPYVQAYHELRVRKQAAQAAGDQLALAEVETELKALTERLSGETKEQSVAATKAAMKEAFPPEFEGRLSGPPVVFNRITPKMATQIVDLNLGELKKTMAYAGHELTWDKKAVQFLVDVGFDLRLGARPLNTAIDRYVTQVAAKRILEAANAGDGKVEPLKIVVTTDKAGSLQISTEALPPKVIAKKDPGEGASQDVFTKVLTAAMQLAAGDATHEVTLGVIDSWIKDAILAYPEADAPAAAKTTANGGEPSQPASETALPAVTTAAAPVLPKASGAFQGDVAVALGPNAARADAAHYQHDAKDANVLAFKKQAAEALKQAGYPQELVDALTRSIPAKDDPYLGWLSVFVEHAKTFTPSDRRATPLTLAVETTDAGARLVIHRNGPMTDLELAKLKAHLTGPAPTSAAASRDKAEAFAVMGKPNSRLMLDLYRVLSQIPGAKLGYAAGEKAQGGAGVDYWVELPKPVAPEPEAQPETPAEPTAAAVPATQPVQGELPTHLLAVTPATERPAQGYMTTRIGLHDANAQDEALKGVRAAAARQMAHYGYSGEAKGAMIKFLDAMADFQKERERGGMADDDRGVTVHYEVTPQGARVGVRGLVRAFSPEEIEQLHALFDGSPKFKRALEQVGARVWYGSNEHSYEGQGASVWIDIPAPAPPGPITQADGQARASSASSNGEASQAQAWTTQPLGLSDDLTAAAERVEHAALAAGVEAHAARSLRDFVVRAARYARTRIRAEHKAVFIEWRRAGTGFEAAVRVDASESFGSVAWHGDIHDDEALLAHLTAARAQLLNDPVESSTPAGFAQRLTARVEAAPATNAAPVLDKIVVPRGAVNPNAPIGLFWIRFNPGLDYDRDVAPLIFRLGLTHVAHWDQGQGLNVQVRVPDGAWLVGQKALALSSEPSVRQIEVLREAQQSAHQSAQEAERPETVNAPKTFVILELMKNNIQDQHFRQGQRKIEEKLAELGASDELKVMAVKFIDRAARFAKEKARLHAEKITVEWRVQGRTIQLSVRRESEHAKDFQRQNWRASIDAEPRLTQLRAAADARVTDGPVPVAGKFSHAFTMTFTVPDNSAAAAQTPATPAAPQAPGDAAQRARDQFRRFAYALLAQGSERGITVRIAAAEALAAASSSEDLAKAREWLALTQTETRHAEIAAGALIAARHGSRADDEPRMRAALTRIGGMYTHEYNPSRRAISQALAKVLVTDNPRKIQEMMTELANSGTNKFIKDALYSALCGSAGLEAEAALKAQWSSSRTWQTPELFDYYKRVNPAHLRGLYAAWKQNPRAVPNAEDRFLVLFAIAEYGEASDLNAFMKIVRDGHWGNSLGIEEAPTAAEAFARFVARLDLIDQVRPELHDWAQEDLSSGNTFSHLMAAVQTFGEAGVEADLPLLEHIIRVDPGYSTIHNYHEMTQHEAGVAWAKLMHREGLIQPRIQTILAMLGDRHGVVNKAALKAVELLFTKPVPPARPPRPAAAPQPFFTQGQDAPPVRGGNTVFLGPGTAIQHGPEVPTALAQAATVWLDALREVLSEAMGLPIVRIITRSNDGLELLWRVRSDAGADVSLETGARGLWVLQRLVAFMDMPPSEREAGLTELEASHPRIRVLYDALVALRAMPRVSMGILRYESNPILHHVEAWLHARLSTTPAPAPRDPLDPRPVHPHAHLADAVDDARRGDPLRPHGMRSIDRDY